MSVESSQIKRVRMYEEPNGSFAVDGTGTLGNYTDVPVIEGTLSFSMSKPTSAVTPLQQYIDGYAEEELLPMGWEMSFEVPLATFDTAADDGVAAAHGALGRLLKIAMGGAWLAIGDTVNDAGPTTSDFDVSNVGFWTPGAGIAISNGGLNDNFGAREIESITGDNLVLKQAFKNAPTNGQDLYASATYHLNTGNGSTTTSAQFIIEGLESQDRWVLLGGQVTNIGFTVGPAIVPRVSFTFSGVYWIDGANAATDLTASALAAASYSNDLINVVQDSVFQCGTVGDATSPDTTPLNVNEIAFNLNLSYLPIQTPAGVQTVAGYVREHRANEPTVTGSFRLPYEDLTYFTARDNRSDHYIFYQIGSTVANRCVLISVPTVQVTDVQLVDAGGIQNQTVSWKARHDADTTEGTSSALGRSAMRIHLF